MQIKDVDKLKAWLLKKLEPLCDADPAALAKYVVALLRKEKPKVALRGLCIDQLEVFLAKETTAFVEKLFRCLESESYLKGEDPPPLTPPTPPHPQPPSAPSIRSSGLPSPSPSIPKSDASSDRRQSEDRHKEVDDDDRDFRRSRRHDTEVSGGGGGGAIRKITAPIGVGSGGGGGRIALGKKRGLNSLPDVTSSSKRRVVLDHSRSAESDGHHRGASSSGVSSSTGPGSGRRPVRERLGPRTDDSRSDRLKRGRSGRSSRSSSGSGSSGSSSSSSSGSDSDSSTSRKERRKKRKMVGGTPAAVAVAKGGSVEVKRRQRCKDYDKRGFCILGESCPYDHGLDPLVIDGNIHPYAHPHPLPPSHPHPPPGMPGMGGVPTLPPPPPPELMSLPPGRHSPPDSKSETYNPEEPGLNSTATSSSSSSGMIPTHIAPPHPIPLRPMFAPPHMPGLMPPHIPGFPPHPHHPHHPFGPSPIIGPPMPHPMRPPRPHFMSGGGSGPRPHLKPSDTLIIRKIPKDLNTITKLSGHFEKFGTIVNITVRYEGDLEGALVQFSSPGEAKKAHDNTEAVLNNRFIRIYYLRKDDAPPLPAIKEFSLEGPVSVAMSHLHPSSNAATTSTPPPTSSSSSSATGAGSMATVTSSETLPPIQPTPDSSGGGAEPEPPTPKQQQRRFPTHSTTNSNRKVEEASNPPLPTSFHETITSSSSSKPSSQPHSRPTQQRRHSAEAAKKNFELQKKTQELLQKQIEQQKLLIAKLEKGGKHLSAEEKNKIMKSLKTLSGSITKLTEVANKTVLTQKQEKQPPVAVVGGPEKRKPAKPAAAAGEHPKTDKQQSLALHKAALKEKAEALRKEAHKLGLISSPSQPLTTTTTTATTAPPTTGKGRGKPDLRNKLHGKPRQLLVIGAKDRDKLTTYFESFGGLDGVEVDPANSNNLIFTFRNNITATQVVNAGSPFSGKPLIMKWYSPKPRLPSQSAPPTLPTLTSSSSNSSVPHHHQHQQQDSKRGATPTHIPLPRQESEGAVPTTPTLTKLDPQELHLVEDSDDEEEGRAWRR